MRKFVGFRTTSSAGIKATVQAKWPYIVSSLTLSKWLHDSFRPQCESERLCICPESERVSDSRCHCHPTHPYCAQELNDGIIYALKQLPVLLNVVFSGYADGRLGIDRLPGGISANAGINRVSSLVWFSKAAVPAITPPLLEAITGTSSRRAVNQNSILSSSCLAVHTGTT